MHWILVTLVSFVVGATSGSLFGVGFLYLAEAPPDYAVLIGGCIGLIFFLFTLNKFGFNPNSPAFHRLKDVVSILKIFE